MSAPIVGTLNWLPADDRPDLLAPPVTAALEDLAAALFVAEIDPSLADTVAFCQAYRVGLEQSANCVIVSGRRREVTTMAACLVLATDRADVNSTVRKRLGARTISFAAMDDAVQQTGMEYGGITPVGLPAPWPILVDRRVTEQPWVVIGSGLRRSKIAIGGADTARLPGAEVVDLALSAAAR